MQRKLPNLRGRVEPEVENEINNFANYLYDVIELLAKRAGVSLDFEQSISPSTTRITQQELRSRERNSSVNLQGGVLAQRLIGQEAETSLQGIVPKEVLRSDFEETAGIVVIDGYIQIRDAKGNSKKILYTN